MRKKRKRLNSSLITYLYTLLVTVGYLLFLPLTPLLLLKPRYRHSLPARFWRWRNPPFARNCIWFHACSLGEVRALAPLIADVASDTVVSVITQTGYEAATQKGWEVRYLPFEPLLLGWVYPQKALVVMEAELWYLLFFLAKRRGAVTMLVNARISDHSWPRYRRFSLFYRALFRWVDRVYAQSPKDAERLRYLGARKIEVTGNIKWANKPNVGRRLAKPHETLIVAASTHAGEEEGILEAFGRFRSAHPASKLVVVPRHPERFEEVYLLMAAMARAKNDTLSRWSQEESLEADMILVDRMGVLIDFYAIADIVVLGGSFVPIGGHNPAEPVAFGCRLISGHYLFNQQAMFAQIEGAIFTSLEQLDGALVQALNAPPTRAKSEVNIAPILKELHRVVSG